MASPPYTNATPGLPATPTPVAQPAAPPYMQSTLAPQQFNMATPYYAPNYNMPTEDVNYDRMLSNSLEYFMDPNSAYIQNARQRGMETAAVRGGVNSSIAAGASERAALDAALPLTQASTGMQAGLQAGREQVRLAEWAATNSFNRELFAQPFTSSMDMLKRFTDASLQDPELYSPSVISGYTNFFNQQMNDMLSRYFGGG